MIRIGIHYGSHEEKRHGEDGPYHVTVETFHIEAVDGDGYRWELEGSHSTDESFVNHLLQHLDHDPVSRPDAWHVVQPVYGSNAWDSEAEYELACFEADSFNEPRPRWR
jgi:hypothetical protein